MKKVGFAIWLIVVLGSTLWLSDFYQISEKEEVIADSLDVDGLESQMADQDSPNGRAEWEHARLANPETGTIPANMRAKELAFARKITNQYAAKAPGVDYNWSWLGPRNVGGRTRALALDVMDENIMLAGGVSGGLWRTIDGGQSWNKVTPSDGHHSVTCIIQDKRPNKTNNWYYGSGEARGNSASKSFSAFYSGNGVYHSSDNGLTWTSLVQTMDTIPQSTGRI